MEAAAANSRRRTVTSLGGELDGWEHTGAEEATSVSTGPQRKRGGVQRTSSTPRIVTSWPGTVQT